MSIATAVADQGDLAHVPLSRISVRPGFNPRRHFDDAALNELAEDIRKAGVIQPITLRPAPAGDDYEVVAGERRYRAAKLVGLESIPAVIRNYSDRDALAAAVSENARRVGISPAEEAKIARQALDLNEGNEELAAKWLGWTRSTLRSRLLLLNANEEVLGGLMRGEIKLGHAELLSTLPEALQSKILGRVVKDAVPVDELKRQLASFTQELSAAPFDTRGCAGCPHNSSTQASLFEQHVGEGRCSNKPCWDAKVEAFLATTKAEKAAEFNVVWFDREKDSGTFTRLIREGQGGVGPTQFDACKACAMNGAMICTKPGKEGRIAGDLCFNTECNREKVKAYANQLSAESAAARATTSERVTTPAQAGDANRKAESTPARAQKKPVSATAAAAPKKNLEANLRVLRSVACDTVLADSHLTLACDVFALASVVKLDRKSFGLPVGGPFGIRHFIDKDEATLREFKTALTKCLFDPQSDEGTRFVGDDNTGRIRVKDSATVIRRRNVGLTRRVVIDKTYLETLTKSGIESLLIEAGFKASCAGDTNEAKEKVFKKILAGKRDEVIAAVLASGHDFSTFVPAAITNCIDQALRGDGSARQVLAADSTSDEDDSDAE